MRTLLLTALIVAWTPAWGQKLDLNFDAVAAKAREKTEVDLDGSALATLLKTVKNQKLGDLASGLTGVFVRNYEFDNSGAFSDRDLEPLRKQVASGSGWTRVVNVKETNESTEIYMFGGGTSPAFLIISAEPKELTVVHVLGTIQIAQLPQLEELVQSTIQYHTNKPVAN